MARDAELRARITAQDDASKVIDGVAKKADKLTDKVEIPIEADTGTAVRDIDGLLQKIDKLGTSDAAALLLTTNASQIATEIADLVIKLDGLDANDPQIDITVANIGQLTGDLDTLAAKAHEINSTPIQLDTTGATGGLRDLGASADSSKSVLANMIGNTTQDLGALGGVAGSAGVAIGQMGEYMADAAANGDNLGQIISGFGAVAGPIAALAAGMQIVSEIMATRAKSAKQEADNIDAMAEAMDAGGSAAEEYAKQLEQAGEIQGRFGKNTADDVGGLTSIAAKLPGLGGIAINIAGHFGLLGEKTEDFTDDLADAGITVDQWATAVAGGEAGAAQMAAALAATGTSADDTNKIMGALGTAQEDWATSTEKAAAAAKVFGTDAGAATGKAVELAKAMQEWAIGEQAKQAGDLAKAMKQWAIEEQVAQAKDLSEAMGDWAVKVTDAQLAVEDLGSFFSQGGIKQDALQGLFDLGNAPLDMQGQVRDIALAIDGLSETAKGVKVGDILAGNIKADDLLDAIDALRPQIQTKITEAFGSGGPEAATKLANDYIDQVWAELGGAEKISRDEVAKLLGLENIEATIAVAVDRSTLETAKRLLETVTGLPGADPLWVAQMKVNLEDPNADVDALLAQIQQKARDLGIILPFAADPTAANDAVTGWGVLANNTTGTSTLDADAAKARAEADAAKAYADGLTASETIDADNQPALAAADGAVDYANRQSGAITIDANLRKGSGWDIFSHPFSVNATANVSGGHSAAPAPAGVGVAATAATTTAVVPMSTGATHGTGQIHVTVAAPPAPTLPPIVVNLDGRPVAAMIAKTAAPAVRAAAMTIRAGRA